MKNEKKKYFLLQTALELTIMICSIFLIRTYILNPVEVHGSSMEPNFHTSDRVWQMKIIDPARFDVITFPSPRDGKSLVKRVIGLPGDALYYENDQLYINGQALDEPYLDEFKSELAEGQSLTRDFSLETLTTVNSAIVPEGKYFVLGDNRQNTDDSRFFGFVDKEQISGVVFFRYYPLDKIGFQ